MGRKSVDVLLSVIGLVLTLVFVVAGALLMWGGNFAKDTVTTQLTAQNIAFDEDASKLPPELASWAGTAVVDGESAKAYSDLIAVHIAGSTDGKSYSQVSGDWFAAGKPGPSADQNTPTTYDVRMTAFMGETLRGMLLNAYAFWTMGTIAVLAAWAAWAAALVMLVLTVLGFTHAKKADEVSGSEGNAGGDNRRLVPSA